MPRKAKEPPKQQIPDGIPAGHAITLAEEKIAHITEAYTEDRDLMNQLLGQVQMARAVSKFTDVVGLSKLQYIKETKLYRALAGKKAIAPDGSEITDVGNWAGFCRLIGSSQQKVDEDLLNLRVFGEEAMDSLTRIGAGYRELRQLRKLPEDQQTALIDVAKLGDKESFVELAEEIITKHAKEKETLTKEKTDLKADYEAQEKIILDKNKKIDAQEKLLHKLQNRSGDWHPRAFEICMENTRIGAGVLEAMDKLDDMRDAILNEDFGEGDHEAAIEAMAVVHYDTLNQIIDRVAEVMAVCEEVFIGYKEKARPMLQVFEAQQG